MNNHEQGFNDTRPQAAYAAQVLLVRHLPDAFDASRRMLDS
jgi:hypothetical protein